MHRKLGQKEKLMPSKPKGWMAKNVDKDFELKIIE